MTARSVAREHYRARARLVRTIERLAAILWRRVDRADIADSWAAMVPHLLAVLIGAQRQAASPADAYLTAVLAEQGLNPATEGRLNVDALTGVASDGRELDVLLNQPVLTSLTSLSRGHTLDRSMASGEAAVRMIAATQVADAGRVADAVAMTSRRDATGYRRMLVGKSCSRCVILAGRWYEHNAGFDRHPRCKQATASISLAARTPPRTSTPTLASISTACRRKSRTKCSRRPARSRSGSAPTWARWSTPAAALKA